MVNIVVVLLVLVFLFVVFWVFGRRGDVFGVNFFCLVVWILDVVRWLGFLVGSVV